MALCRLLLEAPDLLLLDEPTNHLDAESVLWLEQFLHRYQGAVLAVTHDRYFLDNVAEWICEVDRGSLYPTRATTPTYPETKAARLAAQGQQRRPLAKRMKKSSSNGAFVSPKARQAKNKARLATTSRWWPRLRSKKVDFTDIHISGRPAPGRRGPRRRAPA